MKNVIIFTVMIVLALAFIAEAQDFSITIDAEKDAFYEGLTGLADGLVYIPSRAYLRDVGTPPDGDADLSSIVWFAWDDDYLYMYEEVKDDIVLCTNTQNWQNDCLELKIDPDPISGLTTQPIAVTFTALDEGDADEPAGVDHGLVDGMLLDATGELWVNSFDDYARGLTDDGYICEYRIALDYINRPVEGSFLNIGVGELFGLSVSQNDNDETQREHMINWSVGHADAVWSTPSFLGSVTFLEDHKLEFVTVNEIDPAGVNDSADVWYVPPGDVGVDAKISRIPDSHSLLQNYPNPFNPSTSISFDLPAQSEVRIAVYDVLGKELTKLVDGVMPAGRHTVQFDGKDLSSGLYLCRMDTKDQSYITRMMLLK